MPDGAGPLGGIPDDGGGTLYGTTTSGATGNGRGAVILLCWSGISSTQGVLDFKNAQGQPNNILSKLQNDIAAGSSSGPTHTDMGLVIGIKAGSCSPSWLSTGTSYPPVPMPSFSSNPWQDAVDGSTLSCGQYNIPPSWDANFDTQYVSAVGSLLATLSTLKIGSTTQTLMDHVVAISDGVMIQTGSDEMGVFSDGCSITNTASSLRTVSMTGYQVAQTWASLPWPDNYTPAKAQAAYRAVFDQLLNLTAGTTNKWGKHVAITQTMDASDAHNWPLLDANGVPLPPQSPPVAAVSMYGTIMQTATADARDCYSNNGTLTTPGAVQHVLLNCPHAPNNLTAEDAAAMAIFGWPGLFNDSDTNMGDPTTMPYSGLPVEGVLLVVNNGANYGGGVKWQFNNDNGGPGGSAYIDQNYVPGLFPDNNINATSCIGREGTTNDDVAPLAIQGCFKTMLKLANQNSGGAITSTTVLDPAGPGINPPSPYLGNKLLLQWIETKAIDGLPFDNGDGGPIQGPLYGCWPRVGIYPPVGPWCQ